MSIAKWRKQKGKDDPHGLKPILRFRPASALICVARPLGVPRLRGPGPPEGGTPNFARPSALRLRVLRASVVSRWEYRVYAGRTAPFRLKAGLRTSRDPSFWYARYTLRAAPAGLLSTFRPLSFVLRLFRIARAGGSV